MIRWIAKQIWEASEISGIGLGNAAPYIFGLMTGAKKMKKK